MNFVQPLRDAPLIAGKIKIYPEHFCYKNDLLQYHQVESISFYWVKKIYTGMASGEAGARMELSIKIIQSNEIFESSVSTSRRHEADKFNDFRNAYNYLDLVTFKHRYKLFMDEFDENGFLIYNHNKIFKNGDVESFGNKLNLHKNKLVRYPFSLQIIYSGSNLKWRLSHPFRSPNIVVETHDDQSVFYDFLKNNFGITLITKQNPYAY